MMAVDTNLYRHYDKDNTLLYIGISLNSIARLNQHKEHSDWFKDITVVKIETFYTRDAALEAERTAIIVEKPLHNVHHNRAIKMPTYRQKYETARDEVTARVVDKFDPLYTLSQASILLGFSVIKLKEFHAKGKINFLTIGHKHHSYKGVKRKLPDYRVSGWQIIDFIEFLEAETEEENDDRFIIR